MEFIDHTGHVFSLPTFDDKPVALQYTESDYIFWIKDNPVSVNNYYILPIRFILDYNEYLESVNEAIISEGIEPSEALKIKISLDSQFYKLIGPKYIQNKLELNKDINAPIKFKLDDFKSELSLEDFYYDINDNSGENIIVYNGNRKFLLFPFYVIGTSKDEGTYLSNISFEITKYQKSTETVSIELTRDGMYDYYMKKILSSINIYTCDANGDNKKLWYTIKTGYNPENSEIIYPYNNGANIQAGGYIRDIYSSLDEKPYQNENNEWICPPNQIHRIRNFTGGIPHDVFHYIHKIPKEKWLLPSNIYEKNEETNEWIIDPQTNWFIEKEHPEGNRIYYIFEGEVKQSCHYCGSIIGFNHDGGSKTSQVSSLLDVNNEPIYVEDWEESTCKNLFDYMRLNELGSGNMMTGDGYTINNTLPLGFNTIIRDLWFDIDNEDIVDADEGTIEVYVPKTEYSQITVGCTFIDECEELIINGKNMGINLPKEILKGLYNSSFYNQYADEKLLKTKLKELLLNYMSIKGECGNFKSVINSLKWFGWGDKIEISKLIKTDNEFQDQFILDYFTIQTDLKETYKYFNSTNLISLSVKGNNETGEYNQQDFSSVLIGEGKPILEDLFDKNIEVTHDELKFYRPYYNFLFNELALKLDCLAYYWQKYFLPIHLKVNRASIEYKVYANTTKMSAVGFEKIIEDPIILHTNNTKVEITNVVFPDTHELLYYKSIHYIDSKFNEFSNYNEDYNGEDLYYVNENCIYIPIKIEDINNQFVYSEYGEYLLIDGEYIKPYKIYNYNDNKLIETDNYQTAQFYKLYYNSTDYEYLQDVERYTKVTEGYFNCKIFLSYIDNETNEEKYLVKDNTFKFYQNEYQYYCNYVIIPRLIKDKSFDWLNTKFRLAIVINNKWYTYDFTIHVPNIYLDLGILNYRYYIGENTTMFKQIKSIGDNRINFNSFMYQPDLVSIDTLFYNKEQDRVLTFIEKLIETEGNQNQIYDFYKKYYKNQIRIPFNRKYYNRIHIFDIYEYDEPIQILDLYEDVKASLGSINKWYVEEHYNNFFDIRLKPADFDNNLDLWMPYIVNEIITVYNMDQILPINKVSIWHGSNESIEIYDLYVENNTLYAKSTKVKNKLKYLNNPFDITLYNQFFDNKYNFKVDFIENCEYDAYLMHDEYYENNEKPSYWYIVLISRYPISNYREQDLTIHQREYKIDNYQLKYSDYSIDKFLVNRMDVIKSNGMNHFNQDDLIIATINNNNYQFNIDLSSKWEITKCYDENESQQVNSPTNMIIIPNNNIDNLYKVGYYDIKLNYTINGLNDQQYFTQGRYRVNLENQEINYPIIKEIEKEIIEIPFFTKITDFKIMFENENGDRIYTKDILDPSQGYVPVGIKIVNKGYFTEDSPAIYMGLCQLSLTNPDLGFKSAGDQNTADIPHLGFNGITINGLTEYAYICYRNENHTSTLSMIYPQHDMIDNLPKDNDGNLLYPAPNGRGFNGNPEANNSSYIDLLNMDDTYNMDLIDDTCAAFDWDGKKNTDIIISNFDEAQYPDWRTIDNLSIYNQTSNNFSPMCACAWRYHTLTTNQGDWYIPAYANVFFLSYNFKKYSDLFMQLNELYPEYCKPDLLSSIDALWTSTACDDNRYMWEIHPCRHAHILSRTTNWKSIPFINIEDDES